MRRLLLVSSAVGMLLTTWLLGAAPASATVLCKNISFPCSSTYSVGTIIKAELEAEGIWAIGFVISHESTVELEVTNPGRATENVSGTVTEFSLGSTNCNYVQSVLSKGKFSISHASEANGTLGLSEFEVSTEGHGECGTFQCVYGTTVTGDLTVEGGTRATIKSNSEATIPKISGGSLLCGTHGVVTARYVVVSPEPLYVLES